MISELELENQLFMLQGNVTETLNKTTSVDTIKNSNSNIVIYLETQPSTCVCVLGKLFGLRMLQVQMMFLIAALTSDNEDGMFELHASTARKSLQQIQQKCPSVEEVFVKYPRYLDRPKKAVSNWNYSSLIDSFPKAFTFFIPIDSD